MVAYFFDSSAIAKRYRRESGSTWVQAVCEPHNHPPLYLSQLAQVEVVAALRRTGRIMRSHSSSVDAAVNRFQRHFALSRPTRTLPEYVIVSVTDPVFSLAAALCNKYWTIVTYPLRTLDAIQLACAISAAANLPAGTLEFVTADARLATIAQQEGFITINPAFAPLP